MTTSQALYVRIAVSPPGPWTDQQRVAAQLRNLEPRRLGVLALCLDRERATTVIDHGSGDGLDPSCIPLAGLEPTATGEWPPPTQIIEVGVPRILVDRNGGSHDCGAPAGCRVLAVWGTTTYPSSGVETIALFGP
jgi:hypothetical protein